MAALRLALAPDFAAVAELAPEWLDLFRQTDSTPFRSPGCLLSWGRHHAPDRLAAIVVREGGRLVGLVPAFDWQGALLLAGTGPTDYNHGLFETGRADVADAALAALGDLADARGCATIDLHQMRPDRLLLRAETPPDWSSEITPGDVCPIAPVLGDDGLGAMPDKWRKKLGYTRRKMERAGGCAIEAATPETVRGLTEALFALHAKRWAALGESGVLGEPLMRAFITEALPAWLDEGLLRLWALRIEGEIAAVVCNLQTPSTNGGGAAHMYLTGFDPARIALGPGTLLIAHTIEQAAREGAREIRFLRGEEPYKANWGAVAQPTFRRTLTRV